ncbi:glutathione S-transferase family protein [Rhodoferax lacus]|uniref:Glutathione S-transferase family protein n=1 Tax=Rhodoferax lacus TaxID=2184758 RepID=A0A3E1RBT0_9BURK|nr:glutathione S-transferase family protein [Rhodoferax lacus]RFO96799.1 glutathione S-transferase family protein [Rhodoferax lacus]
MLLVGQYDSPVTRRVAIALHHYHIPFTRDTRSIFGDAPAVGKISPLTRIPALVLDDGEVLIDSAAILDHLDEQAGEAALIPASGPARRRVLQMTALAQGTLEKVAAVVYERHFHSSDHRSADWLDRCLGQARAGLDELTRRLATPYACGATLSHADIMITTLIWYMQDRMDEVLSPTAHANLITLAQHCETLPALRAAALSDFEKMPRNKDEFKP